MSTYDYKHDWKHTVKTLEYENAALQAENAALRRWSAAWKASARMYRDAFHDITDRSAEKIAELETQLAESRSVGAGGITHTFGGRETETKP